MSGARTARRWAACQQGEDRVAADRITASQGQEITLMQGWLQTWGKPTTPAGMDHGAMQMPGMMGEADMGQLGRSQRRGLRPAVPRHDDRPPSGPD